jgi:hypothetical protein
MLLWGDAEFAAGYSRAFGFCGSNGVEIMEPLSFKGRRGSGLRGSRCGYADRSLDPQWDWQKYEYSTRVWGRLLYNPDARPEVLRRTLTKQFGNGAGAMETALGSVSRILPTVTTAYAPSAANNAYWPEMYVNQSMADAEHFEPYGDGETPRVFGNASPFDPELFLRVDQYAGELLDGNASGRYTPVEVAQWIEDFAAAGRGGIKDAARGGESVEFRRARVDIEIEAALGEFFAAKLRSGVLLEIYQASREEAALRAAIEQYRKARAAYAAGANVARDVYVSDVTFGEQTFLRGHWLDRLPAMDKDIGALAGMLGGGTKIEASPKVANAIGAVLGRPQRGPLPVQHNVPQRFKRGEDLLIALTSRGDISGARLHYRRVNQAENYVTADMEKKGDEFRAAIRGDYTRTAFPLEYYFEVRKSDGVAGLYPGFSPQLTGCPYFVVQRS